MNRNIILTCAVTGAGDTTSKSPHVPVTPEQIANAAIDAAKAGASIVHCHVRDPKTGKGSRDIHLYQELVDRIRASETDAVINLTAGMGGDLYIGRGESPMDFESSTDLVGPLERLVHIEKLLPEICTMDMGSLNFGNDNLVYVSTPEMLTTGLKRVKELGVLPELEIFDTGNLWFAKDCIQQGIIDKAMFQICTGIPYGLAATPNLLAAVVNELPDNFPWAAFGLGSMQLPMAAQAALLNGHVRVGLEDNLYLEKGVLATNAQLVEKTATMLNCMGASIMTPQQTRDYLAIDKPVQ